MIYLITDPNKIQLFMTAQNGDFKVETMGQSRLLLVSKGNLDHVFKIVKEKTGVQLDSASSSLMYLSDSNDVSSLSIDQMAQLSVSGTTDVAKNEAKTYSFDELSNDAFNVLSAMALVDGSGIVFDYENKTVVVESNADFPLETVLTKQVTSTTEEIKNDNGEVIGERVSQTEKYVPVSVPIDDVIKSVETREPLDPSASPVVSLEADSSSDWYKKIIAGAAGAAGLLVIALFMSGLIQDFAASKVRRGSTNRIYIRLAGVGSLRHRKRGYGKEFESSISAILSDSDALFYNVSVIRALNVVGTGVTGGSVSHYEPIIDFGFEHGLFMVHTPTTSFVVTSFNKTDMSLGLYDTSNESDSIADGLYSGFLKPDVNNVFN